MDTTWYHYSFGDTEKAGDVLIFALQSLEVDVHFPASVYSPCSLNMVTEQFWTWWDAVFGSFCYTFAATLLAHGSVNVESRTTLLWLFPLLCVGGLIYVCFILAEEDIRRDFRKRKEVSLATLASAIALGLKQPRESPLLRWSACLRTHLLPSLL